MTRSATWVLLLFLLFLLSGASCAPEPREESETPRIHDAVGTIISVEGERVLIDHEDIPGFMDAMTMAFPVADPSLLEGLEEGARVEFRVAVDGASYEIVAIEVVSFE